MANDITIEERKRIFLAYPIFLCIFGPKNIYTVNSNTL